MRHLQVNLTLTVSRGTLKTGLWSFVSLLAHLPTVPDDAILKPVWRGAKICSTRLVAT